MKYLFRKDQIRQSLRFGLAGGWKRDRTAMEFLRSMERCPVLMGSFLPSDEQVFTGLDPVNGERRLYRTDAGHMNIHLWNSAGIGTVPKVLAADVIPTGGLRGLDRKAPFVQRLLTAYLRDYKVSDIVDLGSKRLEVTNSVAFANG